MALKIVRVIAAAADRPNRVPTYNISTSKAFDVHNQWPTFLQATGPAAHHEYPEIAAGLTGPTGQFKNGLKTVYIAGYTGPA
jgi:hypothetical protein